MTTLPSIAIIGAGSMGGAILGGLLAPGVSVEGGIRVTNRTEAKAARVRLPGVDSIALESEPDGNEAIRAANNSIRSSLIASLRSVDLTFSN